ncbi:hypothetical protein FOA43_004209 [Brettanomyces nanus]|uniref:Large ribosomal subunit protein bL21m n=1 Tax=Eeniella nana TaxID=13502 RepID=A0A875S9J9_EENNA|nr:uncharacterized protein FOA43_004209 [Brettanomyces nanus]QPG76815.1 hypothetical protein FOA43_004209 [Brettanomyces nanus]
MLPRTIFNNLRPATRSFALGCYRGTGLIISRYLSTNLNTHQTLSTSGSTTKLAKSQQQSIEAIGITDLTPLKYEGNIYATINIHNRPYLITEGDEIILPFRMKHADIGDVLEFTDITTLGSRNYTYHMKKGVDPSFASIKGVILEKTKSPMYIKEVTKRRNRHVRHVEVKHDLTKIRITQLKLTL